MHTITARAAVDFTPSNFEASPAQPSSRPARTVRWARHPINTAAGRCVALRSEGDRLWVALAASPRPRWLAADAVLSPRALARWLAQGF